MCGCELTIARFLFRDIKRSCCLIFLTTSMSLGRRSGCSKASTIWAEWPLWNSLTEAFQRIAAPSTSSWGDQVRFWRRTYALIYSSQLSTKMDLLSLGSLAIFCCLVPFWGATSPSSSTCIGLFFFRFGIAFNLRSVGGRGGRGGKVGGTWPLFLAVMRSLRPLFPRFNFISSFSSEEVLSGRAITKIGAWTP